MSCTHVVMSRCARTRGPSRGLRLPVSNDAARSGASTSPDEMARVTPNTTASRRLPLRSAHGRSSFGTTTGSSRPARRARFRSISERWDSTCSTIVARSRSSSNGSVCSRVNSAIEGCSCEASGWSAPPIRTGNTRVPEASAVAISRTTQSSGSADPQLPVTLAEPFRADDGDHQVAVGDLVVQCVGEVVSGAERTVVERRLDPVDCVERAQSFREPADAVHTVGSTVGDEHPRHVDSLSDA